MDEGYQCTPTVRGFLVDNFHDVNLTCHLYDKMEKVARFPVSLLTIMNVSVWH